MEPTETPPRPRGFIVLRFTPEEYQQLCVCYGFEGRPLSFILHDEIMARVADVLAPPEPPGLRTVVFEHVQQVTEEDAEEIRLLEGVDLDV